ncbi:MAG: hypothetical protein K1060chlam5_00349 [Candidatus Anoxychlamydiales bacterium]|nr:hypothetical protein [Candidatus Anoxychlamydiales bacterium]
MSISNTGAPLASSQVEAKQPETEATQGAPEGVAADASSTIESAAPATESKDGIITKTYKICTGVISSTFGFAFSLVKSLFSGIASIFSLFFSSEEEEEEELSETEQEIADLETKMEELKKETDELQEINAENLTEKSEGLFGQASTEMYTFIGKEAKKSYSHFGYARYTYNDSNHGKNLAKANPLLIREELVKANDAKLEGLKAEKAALEAPTEEAAAEETPAAV